MGATIGATDASKSHNWESCLHSGGKIRIFNYNLLTCIQEHSKKPC